jgi:hypothetical protein
MTRKRSASVALGGLFAAIAMAACGTDPEPDPDYSQICVDEQTKLRVDDDECDDDDHHGRSWFYLPYSRAVPAVGGLVDTTHGSYTRPPTGRIAPVSKGGFGGRATGGGS